MTAMHGDKWLIGTKKVRPTIRPCSAFLISKSFIYRKEATADLMKHKATYIANVIMKPTKLSIHFTISG